LGKLDVFSILLVLGVNFACVILWHCLICDQFCGAWKRCEFQKWVSNCDLLRVYCVILVLLSLI